MSRIQLVIRESGKEPREVPLATAIVVGRSRKADLAIADEEVGREQFRIGVEHGMVVIEGIGKTNRTTVDGVPLGPGERTVVAPGAVIKVGRTTFEIRDGAPTEDTGGDPTPDRTIIAPGPAFPPKPAAAAPAPAPAPAEGPAPELPKAEQTGGFQGPARTIEFARPGGKAPAAPPTPPPSPAARPPVATPKPSPAAPPPAAAPSLDQTMQMGGYRPGMANAKSPPPPAAATPAAPPAAPAPKPAPAPAAPAPTPAPAPAAPPKAADKPKTVVVPPQEMDALRAAGPEVESRLHVTMPRLLVKGEGIKRRVRLMKAVNKVGRAETADVLLAHESVSEQHAELRFDGTAWSVVDVGSTNGTVADGNLLRMSQQPLRRNSLLGFGNICALFLLNDAAESRAEQKLEERALKLLVRAGRLPKEEAKQLQQMARSESSQSLAETLLLETSIGATDWAQAIEAVRGQVSLLDRLRRLFSRRRPPTA